MDAYIDKINKMSFQRLRDELSICVDNPVKNLLIRKLMKQKYIEYKKRKEIYEMKKRNNYNKIKKRKIIEDNTSRMLAEELLEDINKNNELRANEINEINEMNEILEFMDEINNNQERVYDHGPLNDLDPSARLYDQKFTEEIEKDEMNNNLMNRLNSDIYIQEMRKNKRKKFETPFSNGPDEKYASFQMDPTIIPNQDFSNKRLLD